MKTCEECKWFDPASFGGRCLNRQVFDGIAESARDIFGDCGPNAFYWEPKEKEE